MNSDFQAGQRVRLKSNPTRSGVLTGVTGGSTTSPRWQVVFPDRTEMVPGLALEPVAEEGGDPFDDMRRLRFGPHRALRAALTHARLGGKLADLIYSMYTTNTDFYAYQFRPVLSFLDSPSRGILIADEVGLGKTIEAGLIWTELRSREDARRLLVLCPAMLCEKWRDELADRFGVDARICSAKDLVATVEQAAGKASSSFAMVASMQGLRGLAGDGGEDDDERGDSPAARLQQLADDSVGDDAPFDLVIIDEAHYMRNPETLTARLGTLVRRMTNNLVLLSATPVHLRNSDLFHLLRLVDADSFPHEWSFDHALEESAPLIALRELLRSGTPDPAELDEKLDDLRGSDIAQRSEALKHLLQERPDARTMASVGDRLALAEQIDRVNPITKVVTRTRKRDVHERRVVRQPIAQRAQMHPVEAEFYEQVTAAVRQYCRQYGSAEGFMLTIPQRQMCSSMAAACRAWAHRSEGIDAEIEEILWETFGDDAASKDGERKRPNARNLITKLSQIAREVGDYAALRRHDSKFETLRVYLQTYWAKQPQAKVVLFAYFRGTLHYLSERLADLGIDSVLLMGGMDKQEALKRFRRPDGPRILLASEVASEGIDLQFSSLLVNYDLPWNPMRIEQRIGRIDRIGQKAERIGILNIFLGLTLDDRVYVRLFERLRVFERALGSIEGILGEMVREMSFDLLRHELTAEEEVGVIEQTAMAVEQKSMIEDQLEQQAGRLVAHGDYLQHRIAAARDLNRYVTSEDLRSYVSDFIDSHCEGGQLIRGDDGDPPTWELDLGTVRRAAFADFIKSRRLDSSTRLTMAASGRQRCVFQNVLGKRHGDAEVVSQYHPLIAFIREQLERDETYRNTTVSAVRIDDSPTGGMAGAPLEPGTYVFAVSCWRLRGEQDSERLAFEARILENGGRLDAEQSERVVGLAMRGKPWIGVGGQLDGDAVGDSFDRVADALDHRYAEFVAAAGRENRDRIRFQLDQVDRQEARDVARLQDLIRMLRLQNKTRTIRANEGRLAKVRERAAERRARLQSRADLKHDSALISVGVILVN